MVEVNEISKSFGDVTAVSRVSFRVAGGEVFGLLGPNGAGKTTTLRILATLIKANSGSATVAGFDIERDPQRVRHAIGVVNGGMGLYDRLTGREVLTYFGGLYGMNQQQMDERINQLDELLSLGDALTRQTGDFSTGMKQKIVIARAVLHDPPVIFFDEATSGLDVMARRAVLDLVSEFARQGKAVVYSTHVMSEVEELCDRIAIVYQGAIVAQDTLPNLLESTGAQSLERAFFDVVKRSGLATELVS